MATRAGGLLLVIAACGAPETHPGHHTPSNPLGPVARSGPPTPVPPPPIPAEYTHRPPPPRALTPDPEALSPHYPIAETYGVQSWSELCDHRSKPKRGNPDELATYVAAWCAAASSPDTAIRQLLSLEHATTPRLPAATSRDLIGLLASSQHASAARALLTAQHMTGWFVQLARSYAGFDKLDDMDEVLAGVTKFEIETDRCVAIGLRAAAHHHVELADRNTVADLAAHDIDCREIAAWVECPLVADRTVTWTSERELRVQVDDELKRCGDASPPAVIAALHARWSSDPQYLLVLGRRLEVLSDPVGEVFLTAAIENVAMTSDCDNRLFEFAIKQLREKASLARLDARIRELQRRHDMRCARQ